MPVNLQSGDFHASRDRECHPSRACQSCTPLHSAPLPPGKSPEPAPKLRVRGSNSTQSPLGGPPEELTRVTCPHWDKSLPHVVRLALKS